MKALARIEHTGVPICAKTYPKLSSKWDNILNHLISQINTRYGVYEENVFKDYLFEKFLVENEIPWPRLKSGKLNKQKDTFRAMAQTYPSLKEFYELRATLGQMRTFDLTVGKDFRNRCMLSAFKTKTGRNAPSSKRFVFALPAWARSLIKPTRGRGLAYIDYSAQEFAIGAVLSGDRNMQEAYISGDPYLAFGKAANIIPEDGTKKTHSRERDIFKTVLLGTNYGMGANTLALRIDRPIRVANALLHTHKRLYPKFWEWVRAVQDYGIICGELYTTFGWKLHVNGDPNPRSLRNFPVQAI
jgi:DNA polymerase I-like protein with 3'-5' exonuclease and polymerase domains